MSFLMESIMVYGIVQIKRAEPIFSRVYPRLVPDPETHGHKN